MSQFIDRMFSEQGDRKSVKEKMPSIEKLQMSIDLTETHNIPKQLIEYTFKALWTMHAHGSADEYDEIHKIAIKSLTRAVYDEFYEKLTYLELALYDYDVEKAKKIMQYIKKEVNL